MDVDAHADLPRELNGDSAGRIILLSAVRFYREGLAEHLRTRGGFRVTALAPDGPGVQHVIEQAPDVVLIDIGSAEGWIALQSIADDAPQLRSVAAGLSGHDGEILECARAGVAGYVTADASLGEVLSILAGVARGELRCPPAAASILRRRLATAAAHDGFEHAATRLTGRETEIARLLAQHLPNKEIAQRLNIAVSTVKSHVHNILEKLRVDSRVKAAGHAPSRGTNGRKPTEASSPQ